MTGPNADIERLMSLELPPHEDRIGRHVVKFTIACMVLFALAAISGLTFALYASLQREDQLTESLSCVRESALTFDVALADGIKLKVDLDVATTHALVAVAESNPALLDEAIDELLAEVADADGIKAALDDAVNDRRNAVANC